jgi:hypothetical protein
MTNPLTRAKIRSGRDDGRPTEDDIARVRQGEQGIPGKAKSQVLGRRQIAEPEADRSGTHGVTFSLP